MTIATLALIGAVALLGPLLACSDSLRIPVVIGELIAGVAIGNTGMRWIDPSEPTLTFLASLGFALVMFVAGSHVPVRDRALRTGAQRALSRLSMTVIASVVLGFAVAAGFGTGHAALYAVLFASSSAAVILPIADSLRLSGAAYVQLLPQVAIADAACIVALPLVLDPAHAWRAAIGAAAVIGCGALLLFALWQAERRGWRRAAHEKS